MSDQQTPESPWAKINVLAALGGTLAALVVAAVTVAAFFHWGTADASTRPQPSPTASGTGPSPTATTGTTAPGANSGARDLTSLTLSRGAGLFTAKGSTLTIPCGTNQSDDLFREIAYSLPTTTPLHRLHAVVRGDGDGADQMFGVTVYAKGQYVRADQTVPIAAANVRPGGSGTLDGTISDNADTLVLRLVCHLPSASVTITGGTLAP